MSIDHLLEEPEDVTNAKPIPYKLQVHKAIRRIDIRCFTTPSATVKSITQLTETNVIFAFNITTKNIILNGKSAQFGKWFLEKCFYE